MVSLSPVNRPVSCPWRRCIVCFNELLGNKTVIPAQAGIHLAQTDFSALGLVDSCLHRSDKLGLAMNNDFFKILHFADSALPSGGFGFSNGLEGAFQLKIVNDEKSLKSFLVNNLKAALNFDIPCIYSCYHLDVEHDKKEITAMFWEYDASVTSSSLRRASFTLGRSWFRLMTNLYPELIKSPLDSFLKIPELPLHLTPVLGTTFKATGMTEVHVKKLYMFMVLRDQVSAAIRLGIIGPNAASRLQLGLYENLEAMLLTVHDLGYTQAFKSSPQIEISQAAHAKLYSRLFQS